MKKAGKSNILLLTLGALFLLCGALALTFAPAPRYSETENRMLADTPHPSLESLKDGSLAAALDLYAAERFPARSTARRLRAVMALAMGQREVRGVILCRDGSLARRIEVNDAIYAQNLAALTRLKAQWEQRGLTTKVAVVPRRIDVCGALLPSLYDQEADRAVWERLWGELPDALSLLDCTKDTYWYRTDHHWTANGAFFAYQALGKELGYLPHNDFEVTTLTDCFYGTSDAAAGIPLVSPDSICAYRFEGDRDYRVFRDGAQAELDGFYDLSKLATRDKYAVFLGGNCGVLEVDLGADDARPTLLLVRDSFSDSLIPFLARHFRIIAIDPRYRIPSLDALVERADSVLMLAGMQTLTTTAFFTPLLKQK